MCKSTLLETGNVRVQHLPKLVNVWFLMMQRRRFKAKLVNYTNRYYNYIQFYFPTLILLLPFTAALSQRPLSLVDLFNIPALPGGRSFVPVCCPVWRSRIMDPHKQLINALTFLWLALQTETPGTEGYSMSPPANSPSSFYCGYLFIQSLFHFTFPPSLSFFVSLYFLSQSYFYVLILCLFFVCLLLSIFSFLVSSRHIKMIKQKEKSLKIQIVPQGSEKPLRRKIE